MDFLREYAAAGRFQNWPATICILLAVAVATIVINAVRRPAFPKTAPPLVDGGGYPVLGLLRYFSDRNNFMHSARQATRSGNFSFYFGKLRIVGLSGLEGRRTFFESKDLNLHEAYAVLFANTPQIDESAKGENRLAYNRWLNQTLITMVRKENLIRTLPHLVGDTQGQLASIIARRDGSPTGIFDPFDDIYRTVYQLTMRTVGADDIAESPELLGQTLDLFEQIDSSRSSSRIIFPWLPTPAHVRRLTAGFKMYRIFQKIVDDRQKTGKRGEDALQFLMDGGESIEKILTFVIAALFAGQLNSGINAAWFLVYLACNAEWYARVQGEVDSAVRRHRTSPLQSANDVLASLTIDDWEASFPLVDLCLRECIRLQTVGTVFRQNNSNKDVPIGKTGEVIPKGTFAVYLVDDTHMNPDIYPDPQRWDPGRYLPERAEDKKAPLNYVGWGTGRHPCLGMRFAKLEMGIIAACFVATFDYELLNAAGEKLDTAPLPNRSYHSASKPDQPLRLRYTVRKP